MTEEPQETIEEPELETTEEPVKKSATSWLIEELKGRNIYDRQTWKKLPPEERASILKRCKDETGRGSISLVYKCIIRIAKEAPETRVSRDAVAPEFMPSKQIKVDLKKDGEQPPEGGAIEPPEIEPPEKAGIEIEPPEPATPKKPISSKDFSIIKMWITKGVGKIFDKASAVTGCDAVKLTPQEAEDIGECWEAVLDQFEEEIDLALILKYGTVIYAIYITGMIVSDKIIVAKKASPKPKTPTEDLREKPPDLQEKMEKQVTEENQEKRVAEDQSFPALKGRM